jgi:hypothetical protein
MGMSIEVRIKKNYALLNDVILKYHPMYSKVDDSFKSAMLYNPHHYNIDLLCEETVAHLMGIEKCDIAQMDFRNGNDHKTSSVNELNGRVSISKVQNKVGDLMVTLHNPLINSTQFLYIPNHAIDGLAGKMHNSVRNIRFTYGGGDAYKKILPYFVPDIETMIRMGKSAEHLMPKPPVDELTKNISRLIHEVMNDMICSRILPSAF